MDLPHYAELLNASPRFASNPISLSSKVLKLYPQETIRKGSEVWAVHVLCDASKRTSTNVLLRAQYNRLLPRDVSSLPEGKVFKYVTYPANSGDSTPPQLILPKKLRIRQQQFQEKHTTSPIRGVTDLDLPLDFGADGLLSLRQILLGTRCQSNWRHPLFLSVDFNAYRNDITVLFHQGNEVEALRLLSALPVFLEAKYNSQIWTWFTHDLKIELEHTRWDPERQCLEELGQDEDNLLASLYGNDVLADWEEVDSLNVPEDPTSSVALDLSLLFNMAPRAGGEGFDENASLNTMKTGTSNATGLAAKLASDLPDDVDVTKDDSTTVASSLTNGSAPTSGASSQGAGVPSDHG